jgi:hypothetical protein
VLSKFVDYDFFPIESSWQDGAIQADRELRLWKSQKITIADVELGVDGVPA